MDDMHVNSGPTRAERRQARMDGRNNPPNHAETQGDLDRLGIPDDICWGVGGRVTSGSGHKPPAPADESFASDDPLSHAVNEMCSAQAVVAAELAEQKQSK